MFPTVFRRRALARDPFDELRREFEGLNRIFGNGGAADVTATYPVDIWEDENHVHVEAEMPGFAREEINVTLENGVLSITAERRIEENDKAEHHLWERRYTRIARRFTLPTLVDENQVDAKLSDGVLKLTMPKKEEVKPRRMELK